MVDRKTLTAQIVNDAKPPPKGECWISDTKLKGFGMRLWSTDRGGEKAFAIRVSDQNGRLIRKTYNVQTSWRIRLRFIYSEETTALRLGDHLEEAREWARDEIDRLKGDLTISQENWVRHKQAAARIRKVTLGTAAQSLLSGMRFNGRSQTYVDRLDKLFENSISVKLKNTRLDRVPAKALARALIRSDIPAGNIRILRSFIGQIFERASSFHGPLGRFQKELAKDFWDRWEKTRGGSGCLNRFSALISGASAGVRLPSGLAAG